jgi:NAD(P)-dependent dehydrogenase (short-subunit alcohol dehydrogenase family)
VEATTVQDWQWIMGVNLIGCVSSVRTFLPVLRAQDTPSRIVVTSSVAALRTPGMIGQTMYMASKAAQLGFCNALRTELADGPVELSVIFPGAVASQIKQKSEQTRPGAIELEVPKAVFGGGSMPAAEAGERIVRGVERGQPYITTHPGDGTLVREAQNLIMAAFTGD